MLIGTHDEDAPTEIVMLTLDYKADLFCFAATLYAGKRGIYPNRYRFF